jgi:hypothetical protein
MRFNKVRFNKVRFNKVRFNKVRFNKVRFNKVRFNKVKEISRNMKAGLELCGSLKLCRLTHLLRLPQPFRLIFFNIFYYLIYYSRLFAAGLSPYFFPAFYYFKFPVRRFMHAELFFPRIYTERLPFFLKIFYTLYNRGKLLKRFACNSDETLL